MALSKDEIVQRIKAHRKPEEVEVPEWGGCVFVRTMTGRERDEWVHPLATGAVPQTEAAIRALVVCVCDEHGERLFDDDAMADLWEAEPKVLDALWEHVDRINGLSQAAGVDEEKN